jgi:hypothetical protein
MPILDNGEPLTINHCPKCNSRRKLVYESPGSTVQTCEAECKKCGWEGKKEDTFKEEKPEPSKYV